MEPGEARGIGCLVAFALASAGAAGLWFLATHGPSGPQTHWERGPGPYLEEVPARTGVAVEGFDPIPGATILTRPHGTPSELAMDGTAVYFVDCAPTTNDCTQLDVRSVVRGAEPRTLASAQPRPRSLVVTSDAVYYLTSRDDRAPGPYGLMKAAKAGGGAVKVADSEQGAFLVLEGGTLTWIEDRSKIVELSVNEGGAPRVMGRLDGEALGLAVDGQSYFVAVKNPSGYVAKPGEEPARAYSIVRQPREEGATPHAIAALDAVGAPVVDAEYVYWAAPAANDYRANYCVSRMSKGGGARTTLHCNGSAKLAMPRALGGRLYVFSDEYRAGTEEELTVLAFGSAGEPPATVFRWNGSYPGGFLYALEGDRMAVSVKGALGLVPASK